ncbi:WhiB family transcriptional regulator [Streptomyces griseosporeus]|uniref:WhiB family transcriptional regulator n=1 Tax=Streptomyces griseosporeus TaxID=1910 RepID=UPI0036FACEE7
MSTHTRRPTTGAAPAPADPFWRDHAACAQVDADLFFPIGDNKLARAQAEQARQVCMGCPVRRQCLSWALATRQDSGVWGGMTEGERRAVHRRRSGTSWGRVRNVAQQMYETRLGEYLALVEQGLTGVELAEALGTNVQTVNRVAEMVRAQKAAEEVRAA